VAISAARKRLTAVETAQDTGRSCLKQYSDRIEAREIDMEMEIGCLASFFFTVETPLNYDSHGLMVKLRARRISRLTAGRFFPARTLLMAVWLILIFRDRPEIDRKQRSMRILTASPGVGGGSRCKRRL